MLSAAELAAALLGHQPPVPLLHPISESVDVIHNSKRVNFRVFIILLALKIKILAEYREWRE